MKGEPLTCLISFRTPAGALWAACSSAKYGADIHVQHHAIPARRARQSSLGCRRGRRMLSDQGAGGAVAVPVVEEPALLLGPLKVSSFPDGIHGLGDNQSRLASSEVRMQRESCIKVQQSRLDLMAPMYRGRRRWKR
jgi:hypothetical protein